MKKQLLILHLFLLTVHISLAQQPASGQAYPKITGYVSVLHPVVTFDKNGSAFNFSGSYTVALPIGINILKSDKIGFSFEIAPFIKAQNDTSKVNFLLFHPGVIVRFKQGLSFITRLAFETSGRYGFTPVVNKVLFKGKGVNYFGAVGAPVRSGNEKPFSVTMVILFGVSF